MFSALDHKDKLLAKINKEIYQNFHCSSIGLVPKKQRGWILITNLSAPQGKSINEFINPEICSFYYSSFNQAVSMVRKLGLLAQISKMEISNEFRLLPIRPEDFALLGFQFLDKNYVDKFLPIGCAISCALFEKFSSFFLHWMLQQSNVKTIVHYLDDFFICWCL